MKSKTSFFNPGLAKNLLRRCWPLWAGYLAVLLLSLPVALYNQQSSFLENPGGFSREISYFLTLTALSSGRLIAVYASFFVSILTAMCMFSFLYNSRSCGMICSLPLRRETVFLTAYLTGLVPLLLADLLTALLTAILFPAGTGLAFSTLLQWLAMTAMGNLTFYGIAVFCAMLTGSSIILPAVYVVLNLAAFVAQICASELLCDIVFGYNQNIYGFNWLSPAVQVAMGFSVVSGEYACTVQGWGTLAAYCALGALLSLAALALYRRRSMETATDTVAYPILKPLFRYCMSVGTALVFSSVVYDGFFNNRFTGFARAVFIALLLVAGAVIGYFAAEMLIQKTLRVFRGKWKGVVTVSVILVALLLCAELDLFGYERRVPAPEEVTAVNISSNAGAILRQPENIEAFTRLHQDIVARKSLHEKNRQESRWLNVTYDLKNGKTLSRSYYIEATQTAAEDPESDISRLQALMNVPEGILSREPIGEFLDVAEIRYVALSNYNTGESWEIPEDQARDFLRDCVVPDLADGSLGVCWLVYPSAYYDLVTPYEIELKLSVPSQGPDGTPERENEYFSFSLQMNAQRTVDWVREHLGLDPAPVERPEPASETVADWPIPATQVIR